MFILMTSIFIEFYFYVLWSLGLIKKPLPTSRSQIFFSIFSRNFIVLAFLLRPVIHFRVIFAYSVRHGLGFMLLYMAIQPHQHLFEKPYFHKDFSRPLLKQYIARRCADPFPGSLFCFIDPMSSLMPTPSYCLIPGLRIQSYKSSHFILCRNRFGRSKYFAFLLKF